MRWLATVLFGVGLGCSGPAPQEPTPEPGERGPGEVEVQTGVEPEAGSDPRTERPRESGSETRSGPAPQTPRVAPPAIAATAVIRTCERPERTRTAPRLREGLVYGRVGRQALRLDLALPAGEGPHPLVLVFHGGGWAAGDRAHVRDDIATLASLGYAGAAVSYRLVSGRSNLFPAQVEDARCAVRYLRRHADRLGIDPARIGALGYSAGGHLALMLGTASEVGGLDRCVDTATSPAVRAVLAYFAPTDLRPERALPLQAEAVVTRLLGSPRRRDPALAALASPIAHVDGTDAPTFLAHGTADRVVPVAHARVMRAALEEAGVPVTLVEVEGAPHGFRLFGPGGHLRPATCTALAFLRATLR